MNRLIDILKKFIEICNRFKFIKIIVYHKISIAILIISAVITFAWAFWLITNEVPSNIFVWDNWDNLFVWDNWDNFITVLTFIVAIAIGWQNYVRSWEENLPNKLTVHFVYNKEYIMSAYTVLLSSKSDLRAWAQQIGSQMIYFKGNSKNNERLSFELTFSQKYLGIINNEFKHYEVTYYLFEEPNIFTEKYTDDYKYITWVIEDNTSENKGDIEKRRHQRIPHENPEDKPLDINVAKTEGIKIEDEDSNP